MILGKLVTVYLLTALQSFYNTKQVGCKMGCRFCATGTMGFKSNLSSGEIVEQLVHASRYSQIRNVVFMVIFTQILVVV
jgi:adenine C2-methylase RlmN of 23S rRNA A2503 and tRNA A37